MSKVPSIDATAMKNLRILRAACQAHGVRLIFSHVNDQPMTVMQKSGFYKKVGAENFALNIDEALEMAQKQVDNNC